MKTLLLVDLSGLWRMNWHATQDMELGEAYSRTVNAVQRIVSHYDYCAICIDRPPYNRKQLHPDYKGQREAPSPQMVEQFDRVKARLEADGLLLWGAAGFEADDIIATAVTTMRRQTVKSADSELEIMIASSDKDLMQLVSDAPRVRQMSFATGQVLDEAAVFEKFGVKPAGMLDLLALTGDASDNVPGVKGVGPKTAAIIVSSPQGLEGALRGEPIKGLTQRLADAIADERETVLLARRLITLATDAPIKFSEVFEHREPKPLANTNNQFDDHEPAVIDAEFEEVPAAAKNSHEAPGAMHPQASPATPTETVVDEVRQAAQRAPRAPAPDALALRPKEWALQLEPGTTRDAYLMAGKLHSSRLFTQFGSADAIFAVVLRGRSLGLDAVTSLANFHVIEGKPTLSAALIVGLVLKSGLAEYFELVESTDEKATWATKRKGGRREVTMSFGVTDALNAGLMAGSPDDARGVPSRSGKPSNYDKYRRNMFRWRAATELARAVYADVCAGLYSPDEIGEGVYDPQIEANISAG